MSAVVPVVPVELVAGSATSAVAAPGNAVQGFGALFDNAVSGLNQQLMTAETGLQNLAAGKTQNLHEVMINLEHAKLQMQLVMQIRNRVLEAYQELMRTQV
ncbi:MAG: flagellar hook-basal body complex protein FliE [Rhodocyclaceae bacterium]